MNITTALLKKNFGCPAGVCKNNYSRKAHWDSYSTTAILICLCRSFISSSYFRFCDLIYRKKELQTWGAMVEQFPSGMK